MVVGLAGIYVPAEVHIIALVILAIYFIGIVISFSKKTFDRVRHIIDFKTVPYYP